jgi:putative transferase (TIGR04331 family)
MESYWGGSEPDAFLGRWCLPYPAELTAPKRLTRVVDYPWYPRQTRVAAYRYCSDLKDTLLGAIAPALDALHGTEYSVHGWNLMLGAWLHRMVMSAYHHHDCLLRARDQFPDLLMHGPAAETCLPPGTTEQFFRDFRGSHRHHALISDLATALGVRCERHLPDGSAADPDQDPPPQQSGAVAGRSWVKEYVKSVGKRAARRATLHANCVLYSASLNVKEANALMLASRFRIARLPLVSLAEERWPAPDNAMRTRLSAQLAAGSGLDGFGRLLAGIVFGNFPVSFGEGFGQLKNIVSENFPRRATRIVSSMAWVGDDAFSLWAAERKMAGAMLVSAQHGGGYGVREMLSGSEFIEDQVTDRFLAWGPATVVGADSRSLPVPPHFHLSGARKGGGRLFYIGGTGGLLFPYGFMSAVDGPDAIEYIERQARFFRALPENLVRQFLIRPNPHDFGWSEKARLLDAIPGLAIDDYSEDFTARLAQARLAVVDNMNTTYLQAMGSGVPTLLVWDSEIWSLNPDAEEAFGELREAGVFFSDPAAAAAAVAWISDDPLSWWHSRPVADAVRTFLGRYYRADNAWLQAWRRELLA